MDNDTLCYAVYKVWGVGGRHRELITTCDGRSDAIATKIKYELQDPDYASYVIEPLGDAPTPARKLPNTANGSNYSSKHRIRRL